MGCLPQNEVCITSSRVTVQNSRITRILDVVGYTISSRGTFHAPSCTSINQTNPLQAAVNTVSKRSARTHPTPPVNPTRRCSYPPCTYDTSPSTGTLISTRSQGFGRYDSAVSPHCVLCNVDLHRMTANYVRVPISKSSLAYEARTRLLRNKTRRSRSREEVITRRTGLERPGTRGTFLGRCLFTCMNNILRPKQGECG